MRKTIFSIALCMVFLMSAVSVSAQEKESEYKKVLTEMLETSGALTAVRNMVPQMIEMMKRSYSNVPEEFWTSFGGKLSDKAYGQLIDIYVPIYQRQLTLDDLKKIIVFYKSPVGKKLAEATPVMTAEAMQSGQALGMQIAQEIMTELKNKGYVKDL